MRCIIFASHNLLAQEIKQGPTQLFLLEQQQQTFPTKDRDRNCCLDLLLLVAPQQSKMLSCSLMRLSVIVEDIYLTCV